ncbi:uncharacterized protein N7473_005751 [Penicillium subrubescens]|uniref:uncharacterized protein n=1 Tax=Penicillium subrubescens TaxID=1316194 RepID=UPI0025450EA2|nr:uncharacterized protein N7473_005751 [Penicillium subrubescens]KAJ5896352.1 hypothetical protein N7473_005751 [Penicillium subrubescens]
MLFGLLPLVLPATAYTPVIVVETSEVTVTPTDVVVKTATSTPTDEPALPTATSEGILTVSLLYPSWLKSILATAIPSTWEERLKTDAAFEEAEYERESEGIMPAWYSRLPSDAKYALSSEKAVEPSEIVALDLSLLAQATEVTTTASPSVTSSSTTVITGSKIAGTSTSTGGAPGATGGLVAGIAGAAGILGLALAL